MTDDQNRNRPQILGALPSDPISHETVQKLGESDATVGTMPIKSRFNDVITEFLLILEGGTYAIAFDPEAETWHLLERRSHDEMRNADVEEELMDLLREWRQEHVLEYLVKRDLLPTFVLDDENS